jgi:hypothetical protein
MDEDHRPPRSVYGRAGSDDRHREGRGQTIRAREAAEALFRPKPPVAATPVPDTPAENRSAHRRRVLPALPVPPPAPIAETPAAIQTKIPASEFARIRAWVTYGMTVRKVAEIYGVPVEEVRRILRIT